MCYNYCHSSFIPNHVTSIHIDLNSNKKNTHKLTYNHKILFIVYTESAQNFSFIKHFFTIFMFPPQKYCFVAWVLFKHWEGENFWSPNSTNSFCRQAVDPILFFVTKTTGSIRLSAQIRIHLVRTKSMHACKNQINNLHSKIICFMKIDRRSSRQIDYTTEQLFNLWKLACARRSVCMTFSPFLKAYYSLSSGKIHLAWGNAYTEVHTYTSSHLIVTFWGFSCYDKRRKSIATSGEKDPSHNLD